jgi:uncharacterized membrane protein
MRKLVRFLSKSALVFTLPAFMVLKSDGIWLWLVSMVIIGIMYMILSRRRKEVRAVIDKVERMPDGTYLVTWGYYNPNSDAISVQHGESCLLVQSGTALLLSKDIPIHFAPGRHHNVIQTVMMEDTQVEWIIGNQRTSCRQTMSIEQESA